MPAENVLYNAPVIAECTALPQCSLVANADQMRPYILERQTGRRNAGTAAGHDVAVKHANGCAEPGHPGVHPVVQPVGIGYSRKSAFAPGRAPGVLNPEAVFVIGNDRERVAAEHSPLLR